MGEAEKKVDSSPRLSPRHNLKEELVERPSSPEINCAICLEELRNKSFTNTCLHQFCFHCLLEWSKVKPECPLCKQGFSRIYHNIRSNEEYDEHVLEPPIPPPHIDPHIFINVAFQRHSFRYRSTMGGGSMMWAFQGFQDQPLSMSTSWSPNHNYPIDYSVPPTTARPARQGATTTRSVTRSQQQDSSATRRNVYRQGLWVRPGTAARFRECSPEFYRLNPAQTHRLVPWLTRELNVLLDMQYDTQSVCQDILNLISAHHINSSVFHRAMTFYLGSTAEHFIHEFYHFAISPHDMHSYDASAQYAQVGRELSSESDSDVEMINLPEPLVRLDLTAAPGPSGLQTQPSQQNPSRNEIVVIELSDDDESRTVDPDSDVEIIAQLPPRHLRTPEVITIDSCSDEDSQRTIKLKSEPLVDYGVISSGEEEQDNEEVEVVSTQPSEEENTSFPTPPYQSEHSQCPIYDNCPYSREICQIVQNRRQPTCKKEPVISSPSVCSSFCSSSTSASTSSTSSSTSSLGTDLEDVEVSSNGRGTTTTTTTTTRCRKGKKTTVNAKRSHKSSGKRIKKLKRSHGSSSSHSRSDEDSIVSTDDTSYSEDNNSIDRKRRRPLRLKSIVLKVDQTKPSTSSSSSCYYTRSHHYTYNRIFSSESDD